MARVRSRDTGLEMLVRRALWARGLRYRVRPMLPGTPDFAFMGARLAVFVDGCFWHECPVHYKAPATNVEFWQRKVERNLARDKRVDEELAGLGWTVLRIWEHEVRWDIHATVERITNALGSMA